MSKTQYKAKIISKTEKGKEVMQKGGDPDKMSKAALKVCGYEYKTISEDPLTIEFSLKRIPGPVWDQIIIGLVTKFADLGAIRDRDYVLEVESK